MGVSLNNLLRYQEDPAFLDNIDKGDETWVHHITPEKKWNSMMWKHPSSPTAKKFKMTASVHKVMATVFWDMKGLLLVDFLNKNESINADHYIETLQKLRQAIRRKRVRMLTRGVKLCMTMQLPTLLEKHVKPLRRWVGKFSNTPLTTLTSHPVTSTCLES
jgi:hypothetical protein